ncbi:major facilitator superfamily domain-containing protein [Podospora appendiculata]|uniref:Major facilitator superfamily domain-containing protein n=1 Tax=Podospora appendiculata TaxID=314037 RepID=A0AAE0XLP3_9PEZI|nr:major facilitator superfamily domain-containing protein [Podospora appendiculata]
MALTNEKLTSSPTDVEEAINDTSSDSDALARLDQLNKEYGATWDSPSDPNNPYNWSTARKISIALIFSFGQLVTLMAASMIAAALDDIIVDLAIDAATAQIVFSTYFLGLAFGPFVVAAFSEMHGRKMVWVYSQVWFILWNLVSPFGNSKGLMIFARLMAGCGASVGTTLTGPVMADMFSISNRGRSMAIASFLPFLGPSLGPIVGGFITQWVTWQWIFYIMSIFSAALTILGLFVIRESYTPILLRRKSPTPSPTKTRLLPSLLRPINLLLHRPIIQLLALLLALNFGLYSLILSTYATLFITRYNQTPSQASLHYLTISLGGTLAAQIGARMMDVIYRRLKARSPNNTSVPEFRVPYMVPGFVFVAAGFFWYAWAAQMTAHWAVVDAGTVVFALGSFMVSQAVLAYKLDEFGDHGASAGAAARCLMYVASFGFPIFAPGLYAALGYGWGNSIFGFAWVVLAWPMLPVFWVFGARLRALGRAEGEHGVVGV